MAIKVDLKKLPNPGILQLLNNLPRELIDSPGFMIVHSASPLDSPSCHKLFICLEPTMTIAGNIGSEENLNLLVETIELLRSHSHLLKIPILSGFFAYEFLHYIEKIKKITLVEPNVPGFYFNLYSLIYEIPLERKIPITVYQLSNLPGQKESWGAEALIGTALLTKSSFEIETESEDPLSLSEVESYLAPYSNFSKAAYLDAVEHIRHEIEAGSVYQVNLSQRFKLPFSHDPYDFYLRLIKHEIACHGAFLNTDLFSVVSESPENFFRFANNEVLVSPIKGTRSKQSNVSNHKIVEQLKNSKKDLAELAMIVDLLRNDLGKNAIPGSVHVSQHARIQQLPHLFHLVSDVRALVNDHVSAFQILCSLFPSGSITGAPKIAAMQYINSIEAVTRGIYTGSIGFFGLGSYAEFNVAIRTALIQGKNIYLNAGGGIVYGSDPEEEYWETIVKAKNLLKAYREITLQ